MPWRGEKNLQAIDLQVFFPLAWPARSGVADVRGMMLAAVLFLPI